MIEAEQVAKVYVKWKGSLWHLAPPWVKIAKSVAQDVPITAELTYLECGSNAPAVAVLDDKEPPLADLCLHCRKRREKKPKLKVGRKVKAPHAVH